MSDVRLWSLPDPQPVVLIALRTLIAGQENASVRRLLSGEFGPAHLRIFVLMQLLLVRLADASERTIALAPPCAQGLTMDEADLIDALSAAAWGDEAGAFERIAALTGADLPGPACEAVTALAAALRDTGCPLGCRVPAGATVH